MRRLNLTAIILFIVASCVLDFNEKVLYFTGSIIFVLGAAFTIVSLIEIKQILENETGFRIEKLRALFQKDEVISNHIKEGYWIFGFGFFGFIFLQSYLIPAFLVTASVVLLINLHVYLYHTYGVIVDE